MLATSTSDQSIVCSGSYLSSERIYDLFAVTNRKSYRLDILRGTMTTEAVPQAVASEKDNNAQVARDFIEAVREGREPTVPGRLVIPAMRVLQRAQDQIDKARLSYGG